jgi:hypothetical protein
LLIRRLLIRGLLIFLGIIIRVILRIIIRIFFVAFFITNFNFKILWCWFHNIISLKESINVISVGFRDLGTFRNLFWLFRHFRLNLFLSFYLLLYYRRSRTNILRLFIFILSSLLNFRIFLFIIHNIIGNNTNNTSQYNKPSYNVNNCLIILSHL